ncbi:hypothetical protein QQ045_021038 [Rhodiola kirilowii]
MKLFMICEYLTSGPAHAIDITREAIRHGADAVITVGVDGTLHEFSVKDQEDLDEDYLDFRAVGDGFIAITPISVSPHNE